MANRQMLWRMFSRSFCVAATAAIALQTGLAQCGEPDVADTLRTADSVQTAYLIDRILIGDGHRPSAQRIEMAAGEARQVILYMDRDGRWHEPVFGVKRAVWRPLGDSVTIAVHRSVNLETYLRRAGGDEDAIALYNSTVANIVWDDPNEPVSAPLGLNAMAFPDDAYWYWDWGSEETDAGVIHVGQHFTPLFYARMALTAADDCETYTHWVNEGFWCQRGDFFAPLGYLELSRQSNELDGHDRHDLETTHRLEDTDGDGANEFVYARRYVIAESGHATTFSDIGEIVFQFDAGDPLPPSSSTIGNVTGHAPTVGGGSPYPQPRGPSFHPVRMILSKGHTLPLRPSLPVLLFPGERTFGSTRSFAHGDNWSAYIGPPTGGGHIIEMGRKNLQVFRERERHDQHWPTLSAWIDGDSIEFVAEVFPQTVSHPDVPACPGMEYAVVLWFDTELVDDFDTRTLSADDIVYIISLNASDSTVSVERFRIEARGEHFSLAPTGDQLGSITPTRRPEYRPHIMRWRLAEEDIGLDSQLGSPPMCGFAAEVVCGFVAVAMKAGQFDEYDWNRIGPMISYPVAFQRTDPGTWSSLMIANRKDSVYASDYRR